jgi:RNA polymerase sigma-70 factor (ECF subfamily)
MIGEPLEIELIEQAKQGDNEAFNHLFVREQRYLFNLMLQLTGDVAAADDLAQEAFWKAFRKMSSFRFEASFRTWLTKIAINIFRNEHRKKARHSTLCLEEIPVPADGDRPERVVIKSELQWCILHNLRYHLPKKYREVLVLRDLQNLSYKEISGVLGWSLSRTKTNLHRARRMFRGQFINGRCKAFTDDYLCICEGIISL